jgi:serine/threonine-protein kinase
VGICEVFCVLQEAVGVALRTHEERVGTLLGGKYRLGAIIGRGGMGAVFEGVHAWTGRSVAVKILNDEHVDSAETAERFLREARVAAGLEHRNVVDVLDMGASGGTVYLVLERLVGESFAALLARKRSLPLALAAGCLLPVMRAVAHAHARGVMHRDIKPENIFLHHDSEGRTVPKILDFGIARAFTGALTPRITQPGFVMGTPSYMSPEQAQGISERVGPAADVWSMAVVWYEALTGAMPFEGASPMAILTAVRDAAHASLAERLPQLPRPVAAAIDRALERDASKRYADMGAFLEALQQSLAQAGAPGLLASAAVIARPTAPAAPARLPSSADDPLVEIDEGPAALSDPPPSRVMRASPLIAFAAAVVAGVLCAVAVARHRGPVVTAQQSLASASSLPLRPTARAPRPAPPSAAAARVAPPVGDAALAAATDAGSALRRRRHRDAPNAAAHPPTRGLALPREHGPLTEYDTAP